MGIAPSALSFLESSFPSFFLAYSLTPERPGVHLSSPWLQAAGAPGTRVCAGGPGHNRKSEMPREKA